MGLYDNIDYEIDCPICKAKVNGFQSKDNDCLLHKLNFLEVDNFYSHCGNCGSWIEFKAKKYIDVKKSIDDYELWIKLK